MIKTLLHKLTNALFRYLLPAYNRSPKSTSAQAIHTSMRTDIDIAGLDKAKITNRADHSISRKNISPNALKVLYKLGDASYAGYLVGGGVRDLLLGYRPKDFDIATNATPEQLKSLFRNARIIGRRFKIVHIRFGREIIEVTTFRAPHNSKHEFEDSASRRQMKELSSAHSSTGMILRDNVYGDIDEDALRRDFTVNALYYTVNNFELLDFSGGITDLNNQLIRMIGDPVERYKEDPVRMLRALRFSAKLNFELEEKTGRPINELASLHESLSPARLFDETLKLLTGGHAKKTFALLKQYKVGAYLFPDTLNALEHTPSCATKLLDLALCNTDIRLAEGKSVTPAFLFAALLWPVFQEKLTKQRDGQQFQLQNYQQTANAVLLEQLNYTSVPKRFSSASREIWELQLRLARRNRRSIESAFAHPRFRAAYDFLLLREESGEQLNNLGQWWTDFQNGDSQHQKSMVDALAPNKNHQRRRRPKTPDGAV